MNWVFLPALQCPHLIAMGTQIQVIQILFVVADQNHIPLNAVVLVGDTRVIRARHIVDPRQRRVQLRVFVDVVRKVLGVLVQKCLRNVHVLLAEGFVLVAAVPAVVHQVRVVLRYLDVVHVFAVCTKVHSGVHAVPIVVLYI